MTTVKDLLERKDPYVVHVSTDCTVLDATKEMNARHVGSVVVCDADRVVGIFSRRTDDPTPSGDGDHGGPDGATSAVSRRGRAPRA